MSDSSKIKINKRNGECDSSSMTSSSCESSSSPTDDRDRNRSVTQSSFDSKGSLQSQELSSSEGQDGLKLKTGASKGVNKCILKNQKEIFTCLQKYMEDRKK